MVDFLKIDLAYWSLGISLIALAVSITKDFIIPRILKPNLEIEGKNDDECPQDALFESLESRNIVSQLKAHGIEPEDTEQISELVAAHRKKSRWLRLRLINKSGLFGNTAKNCYVKLIEIRNSRGQTIRPFNTFPLMWVSYANSKNNLAKGEHHLLDLAFEIEDERVLYPATYNGFGLPNSLIERKKEKLGPDVYIFKLGIYGDNFDSSTKEFKISLTKKFGELKFED